MPEADSVIVLAASLSKDRAAVGSYQTQYWLLTFALPNIDSAQPWTKPLSQPRPKPPRSPSSSPPPSRPGTPELPALPSKGLTSQRSKNILTPAYTHSGSGRSSITHSHSATTTLSPASSPYVYPGGLTSSRHPSTLRASHLAEGEGAATFTLERRKPAQVFVPKARVEEEEGKLFHLRLRTGGRPEGSAMVLANDGTATVVIFEEWEPWLYQVNPGWEAGKVLDAVSMPLQPRGDATRMLEGNDMEELAEAKEGDKDEIGVDEEARMGADSEISFAGHSQQDGGQLWTVLTRSGGIWAIPEKVVVSHALEPVGRSPGLERRVHGWPSGPQDREQGMLQGSPEQGNTLKRMFADRELDAEEISDEDSALVFAFPELSSPGAGLRGRPQPGTKSERSAGGSRAAQQAEWQIVPLPATSAPQSDTNASPDNPLNQVQVESPTQDRTADRVPEQALMAKQPLAIQLPPAGHGGAEDDGQAIVARLFVHSVAARESSDTLQRTAPPLTALQDLKAAGAFELTGSHNVFARTSQAIVDALMKQWGSGQWAAGDRGFGGGGTAAVMGQLAEKQRRHSLYLEFLSETRCHQELLQSQREFRQALDVLLLGCLGSAFVPNEHHLRAACAYSQKIDTMQEVCLLSHPLVRSNQRSSSLTSS